MPPRGTDGRPVLAHLAREVGCTPGAFRSGHCPDLLAAAAAELGTTDGAYLRTEITGRIGGQPWITQIPYAAAEHVARLLQAAAWVTVAYLSGMRDGEVKHLRRGCLRVSRVEDGRVYRRKGQQPGLQRGTRPRRRPRHLDRRRTRRTGCPSPGTPAP